MRYICADIRMLMAVILILSSGIEAEGEDYRQLCERHPDLIRALGDGYDIQDSTIEAIEEIGSMVDLYEFLRWQIDNVDYVRRFFPVPAYYNPGLHTIPALLSYTGDKRALPHAKQWFHSFLQQESNVGAESAAHLMRFGWDDLESVAMIVEAMQHGASARKQSIAESTIGRGGVPKQFALPEPLRKVVWEFLEEAESTKGDLAGLILSFWQRSVMHPPRKDELLEILRLSVKKYVEQSSKRHITSALNTMVSITLDHYPKDTRIPEELHEGLKEMVNSTLTDSSDFHREFCSDLLARIEERRKQDESLGQSSDGATGIDGGEAGARRKERNRTEADVATRSGSTGKSTDAPASSARPPDSTASRAWIVWVTIGVGAIAVVTAIATLRRKKSVR